jgi:hypothetical protein
MVLSALAMHQSVPQSDPISGHMYLAPLERRRPTPSLAVCREGEGKAPQAAVHDRHDAQQGASVYWVGLHVYKVHLCRCRRDGQVESAVMESNSNGDQCNRSLELVTCMPVPIGHASVAISLVISPHTCNP